MTKQTITLLAITSLTCLALSSCAVVTVPLKVAGKATTTSIGVAGNVVGAGVGAMSSDSDE